MTPPGAALDTVVTKEATGASSPSEPAGGAAEWPVQATDAIVRVVDSVRDKTTGRALDVARWLTYGLVPALLALPLLVLLLVGLLRLFEGLLLWVHEQGWAPVLHDPIGFVYLLFGLIFVLAGLVCWRKGKAPAPA